MGLALSADRDDTFDNVINVNEVINNNLYNPHESINPELSKIQEGSTESYTSNAVSSSDEESVGFATPTLLLDNPFIAELAGRWGRYWERCVADGTLHEVCCVGATLCFAAATLLLCNTVMEVELVPDGVHRHVPSLFCSK